MWRQAPNYHTRPLLSTPAVLSSQMSGENKEVAEVGGGLQQHLRKRCAAVGLILFLLAINELEEDWNTD